MLQVRRQLQQSLTCLRKKLEVAGCCSKPLWPGEGEGKAKAESSTVVIVTLQRIACAFLPSSPGPDRTAPPWASSRGGGQGCPALYLGAARPPAPWAALPSCLAFSPAAAGGPCAAGGCRVGRGGVRQSCGPVAAGQRLCAARSHGPVPPGSPLVASRALPATGTALLPPAGCRCRGLRCGRRRRRGAAAALLARAPGEWRQRGGTRGSLGGAGGGLGGSAAPRVTGGPARPGRGGRCPPAGAGGSPAAGPSLHGEAWGSRAASRAPAPAPAAAGSPSSPPAGLAAGRSPQTARWHCLEPSGGGAEGREQSRTPPPSCRAAVVGVRWSRCRCCRRRRGRLASSAAKGLGHRSLFSRERNEGRRLIRFKTGV